MKNWRKKGRRPWTDRDDRIMADLYPETNTKDLAERLGRTDRAVYMRAENLGLKKTSAYLAKNVHTIDPLAGEPYRIKLGNKPWNAGKKGWQAGGRSIDTQFTSDDVRRNSEPLGTEKINKDGVLMRKVSDSPIRKERWRPVHVLVYEEHHGSVPVGHIVVFKDRDRGNFDPENLEAITRAENMRRNSHYNRYPIEISRLIQLRGALNRQINKRANHEKQD